MYASVDAAIAAGKQPGQLSAALGIEDLSGSGEPGLILGSSDGYLYALKLEPLQIAWSMDFRAAVGEPIAADTDGDGVAEILAPISDGHVAVVTNADLPSPQAVFETDCDAPADASDDVDAISTTGPLNVSWLPVAGSTGYRVLVLRDDGVVVSDWADVGDVTSVVLKGIVFEEGARYHVRVRAYADGTSAPIVSEETSSDGFVAVARSACPSGRAASGCCSSTDSTGSNVANGAILVVLCGLSLRRRRPRLA
jgi:hypothetical protein